MQLPTHNIEAYAKARDLTILEAFVECYCRYLERSQDSLIPKEHARILQHRYDYDQKKFVPYYVSGQLARIRRKQQLEMIRPDYGEDAPLFIG